MQPSKDKVTKPIDKRLHLCPYCYERLSAMQSVKRKLTGQVKCPGCGKMITDDRYKTY